MIAFKYVTMIIALLLVLSMVLLVRCSCCSRLWQVKRRISAKTSVVHGLSAFLIICYTKCTKISLNILFTQPVVLTEAAEGEEVEGEGVEQQYQRRKHCHKRKNHQSRYCIDEVFATKIRQSAIVRIKIFCEGLIINARSLSALQKETSHCVGCSDLLQPCCHHWMQPCDSLGRFPAVHPRLILLLDYVQLFLLHLPLIVVVFYLSKFTFLFLKPKCCVSSAQEVNTMMDYSSSSPGNFHGPQHPFSSNRLGYYGSIVDNSSLYYVWVCAS